MHEATDLPPPMPSLDEIRDKEIVVSCIESSNYRSKMRGKIIQFGASGNFWWLFSSVNTQRYVFVSLEQPINFCAGCLSGFRQWDVSQTRSPLLWSEHWNLFFSSQRLSCLFFSTDISMPESTAAQISVNRQMLRYFDPCQLLVSRSATLLAYICPHLRG